MLRLRPSPSAEFFLNFEHLLIIRSCIFYANKRTNTLPMDNFFCVVSGRKSAATAQFFVANQWQHGANFVANHGQAWLIYKKKREDYTSTLGWKKGTCNPRVMCVGSVVYFDCVSSCRQMRNALKLVAPEISVVCRQRQHLISSTPPPVLPLRGGTCGRK